MLWYVSFNSAVCVMNGELQSESQHQLVNGAEEKKNITAFLKPHLKRTMLGSSNSQHIHLLHSLFIRDREAGRNVLVADVASDFFSASVASCLEDGPQKFCQITVQRVGGGACAQG